MSRLRRVAGWSTAALVVVAGIIPAKFVSEEPGPTFNTIGEYDSRQLIEIEGTESYPVSGALDMTTVAVSGGPNTDATALQVLGSWLAPSSRVLPSDLLYPPTVTSEEVSAKNTADMTDSQSQAQAAALTYMGIDYTQKLTVAGFSEGSDAENKLQEGDVLTKIGSTTITRFEQISQVLEHSQGEPVEVSYTRDGQEGSVSISPQKSEDSGKYILGVLLKRSFDFPFTVKYGVEEVGGPSAGMMFALGIIDETTPEDLTGGVHFAGTGTIDESGTVGPIGGIAQKMVGAQKAGATVFLAPADNCDEVVGQVPSGLSVIKVSTLQEAADAVKAVGQGKDPASFATCTAP